MKENPRWVDRALAESMDDIKDIARANSLPLPVGGPQYEELGCGHYGCVLETQDEGIVFKLTSDPTEAMFIGRTLDEQFQYAEDDSWGMVIYFAYVGLDFTFRRRNVYAIWREAAFNIGGLIDKSWMTARPSWDVREKRESLANLRLYQDGASMIKDKVERSRNPRRLLEEAERMDRQARDIVMEHFIEQQTLYRRMAPGNPIWDRYTGALGVAVGMQLCHEAAITMITSDRYLSSVGNVFMHYLEKNVYLADVHGNNIGVVYRYHDIDEDMSHGTWAITDPGHAIFLSDFWSR